MTTSHEAFEKQNPVPDYYRFHNGQYIQAYPISEAQWRESVEYHNAWLLWQQAWQASRGALLEEIKAGPYVSRDAGVFYRLPEGEV